MKETELSVEEPSYKQIQERAAKAQEQTAPSLPSPESGTTDKQAICILAQQLVDEIAATLGCARLWVISYAEKERTLRRIAAAGGLPQTSDCAVWPLAEFAGAERTLRTRQLLIVPDPGALPPSVADAFTGEVALVPIAIAGRPIGLLVALPGPGVAFRSLAWERRIAEITSRVALLIELERVASAYQAEKHLIQVTRLTSAAILEGRPLNEIAQILVDAVAQHLKEERVALFLQVDSIPRPLVLRNVSAQYGEAIARLARPSPIVTRAQATGLPYYARNVQEDPQASPELRALYCKENITHVLIALLQHEDKILGGLLVYPRGDREFTPGEYSVFRSLADKLTLSIAISELVDQQREVAMSGERDRLAREIHDTVAQSLVGLLLQLEAMQNSLSLQDMTAVNEMLVAARAQGKKALEETRRAVQGLGPASLDHLSLAQAIREEVHQFSADAEIEAHFLLSGEEQTIPGEQRTALVRIVQESLSNIRKHAEARRVRVGLQYGAEEIVLLIEDDGIGFDTGARAAPGPEGGYGLFGMSERARLVGGELQIDSTLGWGTRIRAVLPYRPASSVAPRLTVPEAPSLRETPASVLPLRPEPPVHEAIPAQARIRALIVDDHAMVRQGIRSVMEAAGDITVVGEASDGAEAQEFARSLRPDVVLMDLQMPNVDGLEAMRRIHAEQPALAVVILTTFNTEASVKEALGGGARGFLLKDADPVDLVAAVRAAYRGEALLSPAVTERLSALASGQSMGPSGTGSIVNEREREVLTLLTQGARNKQIAAKLFITTSTVEYHLTNIFSKLNVSNRTEAVRVALQLGLVGK